MRGRQGQTGTNGDEESRLSAAGSFANRLEFAAESGDTSGMEGGATATRQKPLRAGVRGNFGARLFAISAAVSAAAFLSIASCSLYVVFAASREYPEPPPLSLGNVFSARVTYLFGGAQLIFNNQDGPYTGSMLGVDDKGNQFDLTGWGAPGIYYRFIKPIPGSSFAHSTHWRWWTLMISVWYPLGIFAILPCAFLIVSLRTRAKNKRLKL